VFSLSLKQGIQILTFAIRQDVLAMLDHPGYDLVEGKCWISSDAVHIPDSLFESWCVDFSVEEFLTLVEEVRVKVSSRIGTFF